MNLKLLHGKEGGQRSRWVGPSEGNWVGPKSVIYRSENVFMKLNLLYRKYVLLKKAPCGKWTPSLRAPCTWSCRCYTYTLDQFLLGPCGLQVPWCPGAQRGKRPVCGKNGALHITLCRKCKLSEVNNVPEAHRKWVNFKSLLTFVYALLLCGLDLQGQGGGVFRGPSAAHVTYLSGSGQLCADAPCHVPQPEQRGPRVMSFCLHPTTHPSPHTQLTQTSVCDRFPSHTSCGFSRPTPDPCLLSLYAKKDAESNRGKSKFDLKESNNNP